MRPSRTSALILVIALLLQSVPAHAEFADVPQDSRYGEAFAYLQKKNVVMGFSDGTVRPGKLLTRVEGLASVLRMREQYAPQVVWFTENLPEMALFSDMRQSDWYASYVEVGFLEGIVKGMGDGTFHPGDPLTVEQALVMLKRAMKHETTVSFQTSDRLQNAPGKWYTDAVSWAVEKNLIAPGERISLGAPITRGQFFSILYRLHSIETKGQYAFQDQPSTIAQNIQAAPSPSNFQPSNAQPFAPPATSIPGPSPAPIPFSVSPLPFHANDPFTLTLPPPTTSFGPEPSVAQEHEFGSLQNFALTIPKLADLSDVTISHPSDPFTKEGILAPLQNGLGHLFAYPGDSGKIMIYGHSSGYWYDASDYTRAFRKINQLVAGDRVYVTYDGQLHIYEVTRKQTIDAKDVTPFNDDGTNELILYTCWPPDSIKQRYLVHATEIETVALR